MISLTNTLSGKKETFLPLDPDNVKMYVCGPTVYDRAHLGNARSAVVYDLLFRLLSATFPKVTYVRNITDVDDKIIAQSNLTGRPIDDITKEMTDFYHQDLSALNCLSPTHEPRATDHINHMIDLIKKLIARGFAYEVEGHVLFMVDKFHEYGALSKRSWKEMIAGARVEVAPFKKNPADFVLWKPAKPGEENASFESPWGIGRPGWHIECSAMSREYLGHTFDIHGGGADLTFPHHENEIAQSTCAEDHAAYAKFWIHNGFLTVAGEKMSKSLGNFRTVHDVLASGVEGVVLRYLYLTTHYRKPLDYNNKALHDAQRSIDKFREAVGEEIDEDTTPPKILSFLADDLNTSLAIAYMHELASEINNGAKDKKSELKQCLNFLGLNLHRKKGLIPEHILAFAACRHTARTNRDWALADAMRKEITTAGYIIKDTADGNWVVTKL